MSSEYVKKKKGREEGRKEGLESGYSPKEELSRPGGPIRPFSFLPKRRPMDDLMLFFLGALCRESGVPSLSEQDRVRADHIWDAPSHPNSFSMPISSSQAIPSLSHPLTLLTFPVGGPHLPGIQPAVPRLGSFSQVGQSEEWEVGCLLGWLAPPLVEPQVPPWGHDSGDREVERLD